MELPIMTTTCHFGIRGRGRGIIISEICSKTTNSSDIRGRGRDIISEICSKTTNSSYIRGRGRGRGIIISKI
jgi:hypothetical protein